MCEELEKLIQQQQADDTYVVYPERGALSLDAPLIAELVGVDEDGKVLSSIRPKPFATKSGGPIPHGTLGGYNNHGCTCPDCRYAIAGYRRVDREAKRWGAPAAVRTALLVALNAHLAARIADPQRNLVSRRPRTFIPRPYVAWLPFFEREHE